MRDDIEYYGSLDKVTSLTNLECPYCKDSFKVDDSKMDYSDGEEVELTCPHCNRDLLISVDRPITIDIFTERKKKDAV